eukprot:4104113-Amphidinium_carterae.1
MSASGGSDGDLPKWVLNVDSKVVHKIVVSSWEVPCELWRAACGWQFGRLGKFALVPDATSGKKVCMNCLPALPPEAAEQVG